MENYLTEEEVEAYVEQQMLMAQESLERTKENKKGNIEDYFPKKPN